MRFNWQKRKKLIPYLFVLPLIISLLSITVYPVLFALKLSFSIWPIERMLQGPRLSGLVNYYAMLKDPDMPRALSFTSIFTVATTIIVFLLGMGIALFLNTEFRGRAIARSAVILPMVMAPVVTGSVWRYMFNREFGLINYFLGLLGISRIAWLGANPWAVIAIIITEVWQGTPFMALVLLAGLQSIPDELYEAAKIDGGSGWQIFRFITLPLLSSAILVGMVLRSTNAFRMFDLSFILTGGGPYRTTETLAFLAYQSAFFYFKLPYAAAISWIVFLANMGISIGFVRLLYSRVGVK